MRHRKLPHLIFVRALLNPWSYFFAICFALCAQLQAIVIEAPHFEELKKHVDEHTLVLLDIDDTLLIPPQMLGSDAWFLYQVEEHVRQGLSQKEAFRKTLEEWHAIRFLTDMEVVEEGTHQIVAELQKKGHKIIGLTTQNITLSDRTAVQLKENRFDLSATAPDRNKHFFLVNEMPILFTHGILFTGGASKGEALFKWCEMTGYKPKKIVFINDKASHLKDVEGVAEKRGVPFVGLRYGYSDARKAAFNPKIADVQFKHSRFDRILSDAEARKMVSP